MHYFALSGPELAALGSGILEHCSELGSSPLESELDSALHSFELVSVQELGLVLFVLLQLP